MSRIGPASRAALLFLALSAMAPAAAGAQQDTVATNELVATLTSLGAKYRTWVTGGGVAGVTTTLFGSFA